MPIYEYRCENGHTFEVMQRMTEDPLVSCTTCAAPVQRVFHPVAVHFKGSGFYTTDYGAKRRSGDGEGAPSDKGEAKPADKGKSSDGGGGGGKSKSSTGGDG
jgi:putative FmdB family regulatory protein